MTDDDSIISNMQAQIANLLASIEWIADTEAFKHEYQRTARYAILRHDQLTSRVKYDEKEQDQ